MIVRVINEPVVGPDDPFGAAAFFAESIDVALMVDPPGCLGEEQLRVGENAAADALSRPSAYVTFETCEAKDLVDLIESILRDRESACLEIVLKL